MHTFYCYFFCFKYKLYLAHIFGECGGDYAGVQGHVGSPGFPFSEYPPDSQCEWTIQVPMNLFIEVIFLYTLLYMFVFFF